MRGYKLLLFKMLIFAALAIVVDVLFGIIFHGLEKKALSNSPYSMVIENAMWKINSDAVIIGASEASHSIVPKILEDSLRMSFYNCGKDGCRFYIQNALINGILDRYTPKMILWSISPNELRTPSEEDNGNLSQLNPFYKNNALVKETLKTKSKYEPIKLMSQSYVFNSRLFPFLFKIFMPDYDYEYGGYSPLDGTDKGLKIKEKEWNRDYNVDVEKVFVETIARCKEAGVEVILVFTPRLEIEYHQDLQSYQALQRVVLDNNLKIIENLYHQDQLMDPMYFKDRGHLNDKGAHIFTSMLASEILH